MEEASGIDHQAPTSVQQGPQKELPVLTAPASDLVVWTPPERAASQQQQAQQWISAAAQTTQGMRQRMSLASDQLGVSIMQLYVSATAISHDLPPPYQHIPGVVPYYHGRTSGPPPSYDEVVNPYAPPPTYSSLFGQVREARKSSRSLCDLVKRLLIILASTLGCTILIAIMILIPFTMIIIGAIYIDDCRIEHIPAFLIIGGLVWAAKNIFRCYVQCHRSFQPPSELNQMDLRTTTTSQTPSTSDTNFSDSDRREPRNIGLHLSKGSICDSLLNCVLFGWFIAGCVIVFKNHEPDFKNQSSLRYCNRTVYMYLFWLITSAMTASGLLLGCVCCLMVSSAIANRQDDEFA